MSLMPEEMRVENSLEIDQTTRLTAESKTILRKYIIVQADFNNFSKIHVAVSYDNQRPKNNEFVTLTRGEPRFFSLRRRIRRLWFYCDHGVQHLSYIAHNYAIQKYPSEIVRIRENVEPRPLTSRHRTGRAIFIDTFENYFAVIGEKWVFSSTGGRGSLALATDYPLKGKYCAKLTTGATASDVAIMTKYFGGTPKSNFGLELNFQSGATVAKIETIIIDMTYRDGTNYYNGVLQYLGEANKKWQYRDSLGGYTDVVGGASDMDLEATYQPQWHNLKLVLDWANLKYKRFICNDVDYASIEGIEFVTVASAGTPRIEIAIAFETAHGSAQIMRVDDVVITDNE